VILRIILAGRSFCVLALALALGAVAAPLRAQDSARQKPARAPAPAAVPVASLAGQQVAVLPITLVAAEPALKNDSVYTVYRDRGVALAWADSVVGAALAERGPEVQWILPAALRRIASRSPGMVKDPQSYGQAVLRSPRIKEVPGSLAADLRNLVAVAGGRVALVPAALLFGRAADGHAVRADLSLVLADARAGKILWRAVASGSGATPAAALDAALATALPLELPR
jgi:hypothetical protein